MKTLMITTVGLLLAGAVGGTQLQAQGVNIKIGNKFELKVGDRDNRRDDRRDDRRDNDRRDNRNDRHENVRKERVWVEDFIMVEEHYETPGHYENVEKKVWIAEKKVTVREDVWVPEAKVVVHEDVWVAARTEERREARRDHCGNIYYVNVCVTIPGHYECQERVKCIPGHYECRDVVKCIPGHYECVTERVFIKGECKTRMVKKSNGGHWEYRNC